jgi:hypothetical protein
MTEKSSIKSLPIVKNFGRKNYGTTVGTQVIGLSDLEEHEMPESATRHRNRKQKRRKKVKY